MHQILEKTDTLSVKAQRFETHQLAILMEPLMIILVCDRPVNLSKPLKPTSAATALLPFETQILKWELRILGPSSFCT